MGERERKRGREPQRGILGHGMAAEARFRGKPNLHGSVLDLLLIFCPGG